ncbi:MAG: hypothetical protein A3F13_03610 [Gammaproteobacteria bacterium RIFCSPHIGHO2_12_FULL_40_19]|nr:MAG: hypothetical protein A3F13_03610 [Gammaproteobacteria bacterium RIFCSPHIGHO2_12_FULL_40_19]
MPEAQRNKRADAKLKQNKPVNKHTIFVTILVSESMFAAHQVGVFSQKMGKKLVEESHEMCNWVKNLAA